MHTLRTWGTVTWYLLMIAPLLSCVFVAEDWGWEVFVGGVGLVTSRGRVLFFLVVDEASKRLFWCGALGHHKSVLVLLFLLLRWVALGSRHVGFVACR